MKRNGEKQEGVRIIEKILHLSYSKFDHIGVMIKEIKDLKEMAIDQLLVLLQVYEENHKDKQGIIEKLINM